MVERRVGAQHQRRRSELLPQIDGRAEADLQRRPVQLHVQPARRDPCEPSPRVRRSGRGSTRRRRSASAPARFRMYAPAVGDAVTGKPDARKIGRTRAPADRREHPPARRRRARGRAPTRRPQRVLGPDPHAERRREVAIDACDVARPAPARSCARASPELSASIERPPTAGPRRRPRPAGSRLASAPVITTLVDVEQARVAQRPVPDRGGDAAHRRAPPRRG